jgi:tetratricopeptide (TPR) repeat protein
MLRLRYSALKFVIVVGCIIFSGVEFTSCDIGVSGARFLNGCFTSARMVALGNAFCAVGNDISGALVNPAVLDYVIYPEIAMMYSSGFMDSVYSFAGFLYPNPKGRHGTFNVSLFLFDGGDIEVNYITGGSEKLKSEEGLVFLGGYGTNVSDDFFVGSNLKFIYNALAGRQYSAFAVGADLGLLYRTVDDRLSVGLSIQNMGTTLKYKNEQHSLPSTIRFGIAWYIKEPLLVAVDVVNTEEQNRINFGLEYELLKIVFFRAGYNMADGVFSIGLGVNVFNGHVDYAYSPLLDSNIHRVTFTMKFGSGKLASIGERYYRKGMLARALHIWEKIPEKFRTAAVREKIDKARTTLTINAHLNKARENYISRNWDAAIKEYQSVLVLDPENKYALEGMQNAIQSKEEERRRKIAFYISQAQSAAKGHRWDAAIQLWKKVLSIDPQNNTAKYGLKEARINRKKELSTEFTELPTRTPPPPKIYAVKPLRGPVGTEVSIIGENFDFDEEENIVLFDKVSADVIKASKKELVARVPTGVGMGKVNIVVRTFAGESSPVPYYVVPSKPPMLNIVNVSFKDENGDNILSAEEKGVITFEIENVPGAGDAFGLVANVIPETPLEKDINIAKDVMVGNIKSGEKRSVEVPIKAGLYIQTGEAILTIKVTEATGFYPDIQKIKIPTEKVKEPDLQIAKFGIDDKLYPDIPEKLSVGNGNGMVEPGESVEVTVSLVNKGRGTTKDTKIYISCDNPEVAFLTETSFAVGNIKPGDWVDVKFVFNIRKDYKQDTIPIKISATDARKIFDKTNMPLPIKVKKPYPKVQLVEVVGKPQEEAPAETPTFGADLYPIPQSAAGVNPNGVAVIVGIRDYRNRDVPQVEYALHDAETVKEYVIKAFGYRRENIIFLENPTKGDLERVFGTRESYKGQLFNYIKKDGSSEIFVYYSGHGAPDLDTKEAYIIPSDCHPDYARLNGYPLDLLYENLSKLPAKSKIVVIDACFSGSSDKGMIITRASGIAVVPKVKFGGILFTAATGDQIASWYPEKQHSMFTYFFLKGLQGAADKNQDKRITVGELGEYVKDNVAYFARRLYNREQMPEFQGPPEEVLLIYK